MLPQVLRRCLLLSVFTLRAAIAQQPIANCSWLDNQLANCGLELSLSEAKALTRNPQSWVPESLQPVITTSGPQMLSIFNVTVSLPSCATLWALAESECTLHASATWPSAGFQVR